MEMDKTRGVLLNVAHYLLTIISFVLWVLCAFLIRVTYMTIFRATVESTFRNTWMVSLIDKFLVIFLAIGIISSVIIVEGRYRKGIYDGSLWGKFFSVTSIQAILLFICQAILTFIFGLIGLNISTLLVAGLAILAILFSLLWYWQSRRGKTAKIISRSGDKI